MKISCPILRYVQTLQIFAQKATPSNKNRNVVCLYSLWSIAENVWQSKLGYVQCVDFSFDIEYMIKMEKSELGYGKWTYHYLLLNWRNKVHIWIVSCVVLIATCRRGGCCCNCCDLWPCRRSARVHSVCSHQGTTPIYVCRWPNWVVIAIMRWEVSTYALNFNWKRVDNSQEIDSI